VLAAVTLLAYGCGESRVEGTWEVDKAAEWKQVDVTFRLALIAKAMGWTIEYV